MNQAQVINLATISSSDKICIVVYGNIASGKSALSRQIIKLLPQFELVCIDNNRRNLFSKIENGIERDRIAEEEMIEQLFSNNYVVYETTGASRLFNTVHPRIIANFSTIVYVQIKCSITECRYRFNNRINDLRVLPSFISKKSITDIMYSIEYGMITKFNLQLDSEKLSTKEMLAQFKARFYRP